MTVFGKSGHAIVWAAVAWLTIAALLALQFWPHLSESGWAWVAFVAVGPPLYVLAESAAEWLWSTRAGRAISQHPSSHVRIVLGVLIFSLVGAAGWAAFSLLKLV